MKYFTLAIWLLFIVSCTGGSKHSGLESVISETYNPDLKKLITLAEGMSGTQEADALLYLLSNMEYKTSLISAESGKSGLSKTPDLDIINADSLLGHVVTACNFWDITPWAQSYQNEVFKKYILPYRIANEPLEYFWRQYSFDRHSSIPKNEADPLAAAIKLHEKVPYHTFNEFWGGTLQSFSLNESKPRGNAMIKLYIMLT